MENIEFDRPLITDSVLVAQEKLNIIRSITSKIIMNNNISVMNELTEIVPEEELLIGTFSSVIKLKINNQNLTKELIEKVDDVFQESEVITEVYISKIQNNAKLELKQIFYICKIKYILFLKENHL